MSGWLTPRWGHPACVRCAGCGKPLTLTWSSSAVGHNIYHGNCFEEQDMKRRKTHA